MKLSGLKTLAYGVAAVSVLMAGAATAQTLTVPATVDVLNTITMSTTSPLNFGTIVAVNDASDTSTVTVDTADAIAATNGGNALIVPVAGTPTAADISVTGGNGATMNFTVNNVQNPTLGSDSMALGTITYLLPAGTEQTGTTFTLAGTGAAQSIKIGGTLTLAAGAQIADGTYSGSFDLVANY